MGKRYWKLMETNIYHNQKEVIGYYKLPEYEYTWDYVNEFIRIVRSYLKTEKNITPSYVKLNGPNENERFIVDYGLWGDFLYIVPCSKEEAKAGIKKSKKQEKEKAKKMADTSKEAKRIAAIFTNDIKDYPYADAFRQYAFLDEIGVELGDLVVVDTVKGPSIAMVVSMESDYSGDYIRSVLAKIPNHNGHEKWKESSVKFDEEEKGMASGGPLEWTPHDPLENME